MARNAKTNHIETPRGIQKWFQVVGFCITGSIPLLLLKWWDMSPETPNSWKHKIRHAAMASHIIDVKYINELENEESGSMCILCGKIVDGLLPPSDAWKPSPYEEEIILKQQDFHGRWGSKTGDQWSKYLASSENMRKRLAELDKAKDECWNKRWE
jgi:hypothetical protein